MIELVRRAPRPKRATTAELGMARSTFYRWQRHYRDQGEAGLMDRKPEPGAVWNRLRPEEQTVIVREALQQPDLSPRELGCYVTQYARHCSVQVATGAGSRRQRNCNTFENAWVSSTAASSSISARV